MRMKVVVIGAGGIGSCSEAAWRSLGTTCGLSIVDRSTSKPSAAMVDSAARVWQHCQDVGPAKPSMLQDIERHRPTEIDAINGAVVREGARLGVPTPYNQALLLLIKGLEDASG